MDPRAERLARRDRRILRMADRGATHADIAAVVGLTSGRVGDIVRRERLSRELQARRRAAQSTAPAGAVLCRDCRHWDRDGHEGMHGCQRLLADFPPDGYCSYGKPVEREGARP